MSAVAVRFPRLAIACGIAVLAASAPRVRAAESYANCVGYVDTVPTTIAAPGTWCLRHDLSTNIASGTAIIIASNDVVLDCNGYKLGGLAAGTSTNATGIGSDGGNRYHIAIRHCTVRGFNYGLFLAPGSGNGGDVVVEDNLFDQNRTYGGVVGGSGNRFVRNRVYNTGGRSGGSAAYGLSGPADYIDNAVDGVAADPATASNYRAYGIQVGPQSGGSEVRGNRISGLHYPGAGGVYGILGGTYDFFVDNRITADAAVPANAGVGITGDTYYNGGCGGNSIANFGTPMANCADLGGNANH
jgi:hypothetical protein